MAEVCRVNAKNRHKGNRRGLWVGLMACVIGLVFFLGRDMYVVAAQQVAYALINLRAFVDAH